MRIRNVFVCLITGRKSPIYKYNMMTQGRIDINQIVNTKYYISLIHNI